jgi:hypothetical protein
MTWEASRRRWPPQAEAERRRALLGDGGNRARAGDGGERGSKIRRRNWGKIGRGEEDERHRARDRCSLVLCVMILYPDMIPYPSLSSLMVCHVTIFAEVGCMIPVRLVTMVVS